MFCLIFFFFKQKTAYEMRISDWSSDVCSSDLERMELVYKIPLAEVVRDFFDQLKSRTQGYASLDYEDAGYATSDLVKVDVLLNSEPADAFSTILHRDKAQDYGRRISEKLKELIPRQKIGRAHV